MFIAGLPMKPATNKFAGPLPLASLWILSTYWAAQWCIASWLKPR